MSIIFQWHAKIIVMRRFAKILTLRCTRFVLSKRSCFAKPMPDYHFELVSWFCFAKSAVSRYSLTLGSLALAKASPKSLLRNFCVDAPRVQKRDAFFLLILVKSAFRFCCHFLNFVFLKKLQVFCCFYARYR